MDRSGNVAPIFALIFLGASTLVGGAVDLGLIQVQKARLQQAADSAALAAASPSGVLNPAAAAASHFAAHFGPDDDATHRFNRDGDVYRVTATSTATLPVLGGFGFASPELAVLAEAVPAQEASIEVAIAYDATNSMAFGSSWTDARAALGDALQSLRLRAEPGHFRVSFVPFQDRVNIGEDNTQWLRGEGGGEGGVEAPLDMVAAGSGGRAEEGEDLYPENWSLEDDWNGCVEPREEVIGEFEWALDADAPSLQAFDVSIPRVTGGLAARGGKYPYCPKEPMLALSEAVDPVLEAADRLKKGGTGRFDVGLAWAWRMLSGGWSDAVGGEGYPASGEDDDDTLKLAVLVTDGHTNAYKYEMDETSDFGWNNGSTTAFEHLVDLCTRMKDDGVTLFVFQINGNRRATSYFEACATSPTHYRAVADTHDLAAAFAHFGRWGGDARLIR